MTPPTTCREVAEFLDGYLGGELDAETVARFEGHLAQCPPCVAYLRTYQSTPALGRAALKGDEAPAEVPPDLVQAILRARRREGG